MNDLVIKDTTIENVAELGLCGYKKPKTPGLTEKTEWLKSCFSQGLIIKTLYSESDGAQGMIEYIPGEFCWRPVDAKGYMFIHCLFVGFKKIYKQQGYASELIKVCEDDAKRQDLNGVAIVTRKGSFMVGKELFLKHDYAVVDTARPDFELLVKKYDENAPAPNFKTNPIPYTDGLTIIRASQCPYTVKNVQEICETAKNEYGIDVNVVDLKNHEEAQNAPNPFGTFCLIYNGEIVADCLISNGRFKNIMKKLEVK